MWTFFLRRLLSLPPLLVVISLLTYLLLQASGGDFFNRLEEDPKVSQDYVMALRKSAGRVVSVKAAERAQIFGEFKVRDRTYAFAEDGTLLRVTHSFDGDGSPVRDVENANPKREQDILKVRNFGKTTLKEVKNKLSALGLSLGVSPDEVGA